MLCIRIFFVAIIIGLIGSLNAAGDRSHFVKNNRLVIGADPERGFFGCFISALNNLAWCDKNKVFPIIYWDKNSCYYDGAGYNEIPNSSFSYNAWEYYFEQVSTHTYKEKDPQWQGFRDLDGKGVSLLKDLGEKYNTKKYRDQMHKIIKKFIQIKPSVLKKVDQFYQKHMDGIITIGLHIRGTDKFTEVKPVSLDAFFQAAREAAKNYPNCQFFIATDEASILEEAQRKLPGKVIYYDSYRSVNGKPLHTHTKGYSKAKLGEEILIEALLLSRCDVFIHTVSNVSMCVLFINPDINNILLRATS